MTQKKKRKTESAADDAAVAEDSSTSTEEQASAGSAGDETSAESRVRRSGRWPVDRLLPVLEALLFAAGDPITVRKLATLVSGADADEIRAALERLGQERQSGGVRLVKVAGGWQLRTASEYQQYVRGLFRARPFRLTRAATEAMSIVAYRQPATRAEIEAVRGVDCGGVLESLVERRLLKIVGRKEVPGRPLLYGTTSEFLELFGLRNLKDLPTLAELGDDAVRMAEQGDFYGEAESTEADDDSEGLGTDGGGVNEDDEEKAEQQHQEQGGDEEQGGEEENREAGDEGSQG